ncbi:hypothetical protein [Kutzneria sp. NPDC051319]|uniref:hypothetical protein n=1 Tax=Kutzneria sp. NPDC051319 TaxID=3155047 RepID=UPI00343527D9
MTASEPIGGAVHRPRRRRAAALALAAAVASLAACTTSPGTDAGRGASDMADMPGMTGMASAPTAPAIADAAPAGTGLSDSQGGYSFVPADVTADTFTFRVNGPDRRAVTRYQPYESRLVVGYLIRSDLSGYQLLDPAMQQDGTWQARLPALHPGSYRAFVTFAAPDSGHGTPLRYTLSKTFAIPGNEPEIPLPPTTTSTTTDGFTVSLAGKPTTGVPSPLRISIASGGKPVQHVDRFLDGYVHLTAFRAGDLASAHLFSTGRDDTGTLTANALFPESGTWRLFAQFQLNSQLHTAAFTVVVSGPS